MKKHFSLSLILIVLFLFTKAQKNAIEYGFQSGVNINSAYGSGISKLSRGSTAGLHAGGHFKIQMAKHFGLKAILAYDQYGWAYHDLAFENGNGTRLETGDLVNKLNYLNLPLLAEYSFGDKTKFYLDGGVFVGYLLSSKMIKKINQPSSYTQNIGSGQRRSGNFGVSAGAGIQIPIAHKIKLDFGVRDNLGLANIYKPQSSSDNATMKTNAFSIVTGLTFQMR